METQELKTQKILLVDDDPIVQEHLGDFLRSYFLEVLTAKNAVEGFDLFEEHKPDIVLTDIEMDKMNGLELARAIKSISPTTVMIVVTGFNDSEYRSSAKALNVDDYIMKPLNFQNLMDSINSALKNRNANPLLPNEYISYLLESSKEALIEVTNRNITYINRNFLDIFEVEKMERFFEKYPNLGELFCKSDGEPFEDRAKLNYLEFIIDDPLDTHTVYVKKDGTITEFTLTKIEFFEGQKILFKLDKEV